MTTEPQIQTFLQGIGPAFNYGKKGVFENEFEEPTYLTFKLRLGMTPVSGLSDNFENIAFQNTSNGIGMGGNYDELPTPLFQLGKTENVRNNYIYSTYKYLYNTNQSTRAELLLDFIHGWNELQNNYDYFFTSISGISEAMKVNPKKGQRVPGDFTLTINFEDSIDQRVRYLLSLYRRACWDDDWQRWALPDMMRFFRMYVYISEVRLFHRPISDSAFRPEIVGGLEKDKNRFIENSKDVLGNYARNLGHGIVAQVGDTIGDIKDNLLNNIPRTGVPIIDNFITDVSGKGMVSTISKNNNRGVGSDPNDVTNESIQEQLANATCIILEAVDNIAPVHLFEFDMCEFDISSINSIWSSSYNSTNGEKQSYSFKIKARNMRVIEHYNVSRNPLVNNDSSLLKTYADLSYQELLSQYLDDYIVNTAYRNLSEIQGEGIEAGSLGNGGFVEAILSQYQGTLSDTSYVTGRDKYSESQKLHASGRAYRQKDDSTGINVSNANNASQKRGSLLLRLVESAIKYGGGWVNKQVDEYGNKLVNSPLGGTNTSLKKIFGALRSGNLFGIVNMAKNMIDGDDRIGLSNKHSAEVFKRSVYELSLKRPINEQEKALVNSAKELLKDNVLLDEISKINREDIDNLIKSVVLYETKKKDEEVNKERIDVELVGNKKEKVNPDIELSKTKKSKIPLETDLVSKVKDKIELGIELEKQEKKDFGLEVELNNGGKSELNLGIELEKTKKKDLPLNLDFNTIEKDEVELGIELEKQEKKERKLGLELENTIKNDIELDLELQKQSNKDKNKLSLFKNFELVMNENSNPNNLSFEMNKTERSNKEISLELVGQMENKGLFLGKFYSKKPNKSFLNGKYVDIDVENPSKSKIKERIQETRIEGKKTSKEEQERLERENFFNKR